MSSESASSGGRILRVTGQGIALLFGLVVLAEIGLRLLLGLGSPPLLRADAEIGYLFQANQERTRFTNRIHINEYHQRSGDVVLADSSRFARILFLGDSVTWGGALTDQSETYPELFEDRLDERCDRPVETLNASAGSWSVGNLRAYAERFGFFGSDLVVLQIGEGDLTQPTSDSSGVGNLCSLPRRSPTLALQEFAKCYWPRATSRLATWKETEERSGGARTESSSAEVSEREQRQLQTNLDHLRALVDSVRAASKPVAIFYHPDRSSVKSKESPPPVLYQEFRTWAERRGIPVLDMQAEWAGEPGVEEYYRDHIHLNERGNAVVARHLAAFVREHRFPVSCP